MNRSALCIKMLHILYGRNQPISRNELAKQLECNPRNIAEFRKELETAGYMINSVTGKYGGYILNEESIFPSLSLNAEEKEAVNEALMYLKAQKNFIYYEKFNTAMNKLKAKVNHRNKSKETIYLGEARKSLSKSEGAMVDMIMEAKEKHSAICFSYNSGYKSSTSKRIVHPYEMIINDEGFYLLADDKSPDKIHGYKYFKIVDARMRDMHIMEQSFHRDIHFKVSDHIGSTTLMKELYEVELEIYGINAHLVNEREIENLISKQLKEDVLYLKFMMAGNLRLKNFILSLGSECKVIAPIDIKEEIQTELKKAIALY